MRVVSFLSFFFRFPTGIRSRGSHSLRTLSDPPSKHCVHPPLFCGSQWDLSAQRKARDGRIRSAVPLFPFLYDTWRGFGGSRWNINDRRLGRIPPLPPLHCRFGMVLLVWFLHVLRFSLLLFHHLSSPYKCQILSDDLFLSLACSASSFTLFGATSCRKRERNWIMPVRARER